MKSFLHYPFHPFAFALYFIFFLYVNNIDEVIPSALILPIVITVSIIGITLLIFWLVTKKSQKNSFYISFVIILFFTYGHVFLLLDGIEINGFDIDRHRYLLACYAIIFVLGIFIIKSKIKISTFTPVSNAIALAVIFSVVINLPFSDFLDSETNYVYDLENESPIFNSELKPDIYYIILDEYAGNESLKNYFNFDNTEFHSFLKANGFHVTSNSKSNYLATALAAPSIMDMRYVHPSEENSDSINFNTIISGSYQQNDVMKFLNQNNYTTIYIYGGILEEIQISDYNLCRDKPITDFHTMLIQTTVLWIIQRNEFISNLNEIRLCAFDELSTAREKFDGPLFVFAHVKLPHDPFTLGANGENIIPDKIDLGITSAGDKIGYINQLKFSNKKIMEIIPKILKIQDMICMVILK